MKTNMRWLFGLAVGMFLLAELATVRARAPFYMPPIHSHYLLPLLAMLFSWAFLVGGIVLLAVWLTSRD